MRLLGPFGIKKEINQKKIPLSSLETGINNFKDFIIKIGDNRVESVIDKICDHAGGKMILRGEELTCPLHGWKLKLESLRYNDSHTTKKQLPYFLSDENIIIEFEKRFLINNFLGKNEAKSKVKWLNHASVEVEYNDIRLVTDPWLVGSAFINGWWLNTPTKKSDFQRFLKSDYIYVSHNHPDHCNRHTLEYLSKKQKFIVPKFSSKSTINILKSYGFENVFELEFNHIYELTDGFQVSILKSGDFRDDSGLYISNGQNQFLFTVDSNFLNGHILPHNLDLLMTAFAGGASGFPLCYNNYTDLQKEEIQQRNLAGLRSNVMDYIKITTPKYYMPYAGMFKEAAIRDLTILQHNQKNSIEDYKILLERNRKTNLIETDNTFHLIFDSEGNMNKVYEEEGESVPNQIPEEVINQSKEIYKPNYTTILKYFKDSNYKDKQLLIIQLTNDNFNPIDKNYILINFFEKEYSLTQEKPNYSLGSLEYKVMEIKVRFESFMLLIENMLPWEDLSIGFQMRINRIPNMYESKFWYHFTNIYIAKEHHRYQPLCGSCNLINQNPKYLSN